MRVCTVFMYQWAANGEQQDEERYGQFGELSGQGEERCRLNFLQFANVIVNVCMITNALKTVLQSMYILLDTWQKIYDLFRYIKRNHRHCATLSSFKAKLKTFFFSQYFHPN